MNRKGTKFFAHDIGQQVNRILLTFIMSDIRNDDTVYVTEAPYSQFNKVLQAIVGPIATASTLENLTQ